MVNEIIQKKIGLFILIFKNSKYWETGVHLFKHHPEFTGLCIQIISDTSSLQSMGGINTNKLLMCQRPSGNKRNQLMGNKQSRAQPIGDIFRTIKIGIKHWMVTFPIFGSHSSDFGVFMRLYTECGDNMDVLYFYCSEHPRVGALPVHSLKPLK